jgi:hypothetical protein
MSMSRWNPIYSYMQEHLKGIIIICSFYSSRWDQKTVQVSNHDDKEVTLGPREVEFGTVK